MNSKALSIEECYSSFHQSGPGSDFLLVLAQLTTSLTHEFRNKSHVFTLRGFQRCCLLWCIIQSCKIHATLLENAENILAAETRIEDSVHHVFIVERQNQKI